MTDRDIFNTQAWNFLQGDRAVEGALRELASDATLVVRNQLGNALATVAGIRDLRHVGWGEGFDGPLWVPENALRSVRPELDTPIPAAGFFPILLAETYGVQVTPGYVDRANGVLLVLNMTDEQLRATGPEDREVFTRVRKALKQCKSRIIFVAPGGTHLVQSLRPLAVEAWSAVHWDGRNAFASTAVEEAVLEAEPAHITVLGLDLEHVFYTAVGACDFMIGRDGLQRSSQSLRLWDLLELGGRVSVPANCTAASGDPAPRPLRELVREHLERDLRVASTAASPRFQATGESIALDILG